MAVIVVTLTILLYESFNIASYYFSAVHLEYKIINQTLMIIKSFL